jgi:hypothetical protein
MKEILRCRGDEERINQFDGGEETTEYDLSKKRSY